MWESSNTSHFHSDAYQQTFDKESTGILCYWYYSLRSNVTHLSLSVKSDITQLLSLKFSCSHHVFWNYYCSIASPQVWPPLIDVWSYRPAFSPHGGGDIILGVVWPILLPIWLPLPASWLSGGPGLYAAGACPITHWAAGTALLWWLWLVFCVPR